MVHIFDTPETTCDDNRRVIVPLPLPEENAARRAILVLELDGGTWKNVI
jgi:hypothetical protein